MASGAKALSWPSSTFFSTHFSTRGTSPARIDLTQCIQHKRITHRILGKEQRHMSLSWVATHWFGMVQVWKKPLDRESRKKLWARRLEPQTPQQHSCASEQIKTPIWTCFWWVQRDASLFSESPSLNVKPSCVAHHHKGTDHTVRCNCIQVRNLDLHKTWTKSNYPWLFDVLYTLRHKPAS